MVKNENITLSYFFVETPPMQVQNAVTDYC